MMVEFKIYSIDEYLERDVHGFYNTHYIGYKNIGNPDYLNDLKNTFNDYSEDKLNNAAQELYGVLKNNLSRFDKSLTICIVPRSKSENTYEHNQLLFKKVIQVLIEELGFQDGSDYIVRHTNTITTHLNKSGYGGDGDMPYPSITKNTCNISKDVKGRQILLIDDIYTIGVNIDEDAIQALFDNGAASVVFYAVGKTI